MRRYNYYVTLTKHIKVNGVIKKTEELETKGFLKYETAKKCFDETEEVLLQNEFKNKTISNFYSNEDATIRKYYENEVGTRVCLELLDMQRI